MSVTDWEARYREDPDPFAVADSWYEQRKMQVGLACLTQQHYRHVWDTACGTGDFTAKLATRAERVTAGDRSETAVRLARAKIAQLVPEVLADIEVNVLPARPVALRSGEVDLVVLSEVLYYLPAEQQQALGRWCAEAAHEVLAISWRYHPSDAVCSGVSANLALGGLLRAAGWRHQVQHDDAEFVVDCWRRNRHGR